MGYVNSDSNIVQQSLNNVKTAIDSLNSTKCSLNTHYAQLGNSWNDKHYRELGDVVQDSKKAINDILKTLLQVEKYLLLLMKSISDYESTNFNSSNAGNISSQNNNASFGNPPTQNEHRPLVRTREGQIQSIMNDIGAYTGKTISADYAERILDSLHDYSGMHYGEIRYAYQNPNAPERLVSQLNLLDEYVNSVPKWEGRIYRGISVSQDIARRILSQRTVDMLGPSSWSSSEMVAQRFARGDNPVHIVFVLSENHHAASITHLATYNGTEEEVLAPSGINYTIDNIRHTNVNGEEYIYVDVHDNQGAI